MTTRATASHPRGDQVREDRISTPVASDPMASVMRFPGAGWFSAALSVITVACSAHSRSPRTPALAAAPDPSTTPVLAKVVDSDADLKSHPVYQRLVDGGVLYALDRDENRGKCKNLRASTPPQLPVNPSLPQAKPGELLRNLGMFFRPPCTDGGYTSTRTFLSGRKARLESSRACAPGSDGAEIHVVSASELRVERVRLFVDSEACERAEAEAPVATSEAPRCFDLFWYDHRDTASPPREPYVVRFERLFAEGGDVWAESDEGPDGCRPAHVTSRLEPGYGASVRLVWSYPSGKGREEIVKEYSYDPVCQLGVEYDSAFRAFDASGKEVGGGASGGAERFQLTEPPADPDQLPIGNFFYTHSACKAAARKVEHLRRPGTVRTG